MISKLRKFRHGSKLRIALLNILVKQIHSEKYEAMDKQFKLIDTDGTGVISRQELAEIMKNVKGIELEDGEIDNIMNEIDYE